jgi:hypothetical protein
VVLAGEPADVADLAEHLGGQHRADPEQLHQAALGLLDRGSDPLLDRCNAPVQVADVGDQVAGELVADDGRRAGRRDLPQQRSGAVSGEVTGSAGGDQIDQQPVQPVEGSGSACGPGPRGGW